MRPAIEHLRSTERRELTLPSQESLDLAELVSPILNKVRSVSEFVSGDKIVRLPYVCSLLYNLRNHVIRAGRDSTNEPFKDFCKQLESFLHAYFPKDLVDEHQFAMGHFLHSYFKGWLWYKLEPEAYKRWLRTYIENHPSHKEFVANAAAGPERPRAKLAPDDYAGLELLAASETTAGKISFF
jgi:hypothetical protein